MSYYVNWKLVNQAMKDKHLDDQMLADKLGVQRATVVSWRHRRTGPSKGDSATILNKLCEILELNKNRILEQTREPQKILYEELLCGMLAIVKLNNAIDDNNDVIREALGKADFKKLCNDISEIRMLATRAYAKLEQDSFDLKKKSC